MDLKKEILLEHSKANTKRIAEYIGSDQLLFKELIELFLHGNYRITQRSARIVRACVMNHPWLIDPFLEDVIDNLNHPVHDAVKRNTIGLLQEMEIPDDQMGKVADLCFGYLSSAKEPVAVKAFSMTVLLKIVQHYPELKEELKNLIEDQMPFGSAGFQSRGKRVLKALEKIK